MVLSKEAFHPSLTTHPPVFDVLATWPSRERLEYDQIIPLAGRLEHGSQPRTPL